MAKMSPEMQEAKDRWASAWGTTEEDPTPSPSPTDASPSKSPSTVPTPDVEFTAEEIQNFVTEFDEMASASLDLDPHPTFSKFLGKVSVPAVHKYSHYLGNAPEKMAGIFWLVYLAFIYMEWRAKELREASEEGEDSGEVEKRKNF